MFGSCFVLFVKLARVATCEKSGSRPVANLVGSWLTYNHMPQYLPLL